MYWVSGYALGQFWIETLPGTGLNVPGNVAILAFKPKSVTVQWILVIVDVKLCLFWKNGMWSRYLLHDKHRIQSIAFYCSRRLSTADEAAYVSALVQRTPATHFCLFPGAFQALHLVFVPYKEWSRLVCKQKHLFNLIIWKYKQMEHCPPLKDRIVAVCFPTRPRWRDWAGPVRTKNVAFRKFYAYSGLSLKALFLHASGLWFVVTLCWCARL